MKTLHDAFEHMLKDVYYAEHAILKAMPDVIDEVSHPDLKDVLEDHVEETREQVKILEEVFKTIDAKPSGEKCDAIEGLIEETNGIIDETEDDMILDASIAAACQAIEHYEIARYGTLREWAKALGNQKAHDLLSDILDMEKSADKKLTDISVDLLKVAA